MTSRIIPKEKMIGLFSNGLIISDNELRKEYKTRNSEYNKRKIPHSDVDTYLNKRWSVSRTLKRDTWIERLKKHQDQLEDDVWCLFYKMGYNELSERTFKIPYYRSDGTTDQKQIDVYAKDDETVLVIECKSNLKRTRRSLQKDLSEIKSFKGQMATAIKDYYGRDFKPKIVWMIVTRNIIWSEPDLERASAEKIRVLTENEIEYYSAYIQHMGPAGRYQVLAELLQGENIPELKNHKVPAVKGKLGKHTYYSFVTTPRNLLKISFVNHLALNHPDGRPAYQRMVNKTRLKKIADFINNGGYFPTNLLVNFTDNCRFDPISNKESSEDVKYGWLYLPSKYKSAWIIDGQHRLYGYSFADESCWDNEVFILAFEKMDTATEADLFITINHEQKSVPKSILIALQADLKWGAENSKDRLGAISSALVKSLNADPAGPLFNKIYIEGLKRESNKPITIPEFSKGISRSKLIGHIIHDQLVPGPLSSSTDEKTIIRAKKIINGFFELLRSDNETRWELGKNGYLLSNPGVRSYLLLLGEIIQYLDRNHNFDSTFAPENLLIQKAHEYIKPVLTFIKTSSDIVLADKFSRKFGEGGVKEYYYNLCEIINKEKKNFGSKEFIDYMGMKTDSRLKQAHQDVIDINKRLMDYVLKILKNTHGEERLESGEDNFWALGIENSTIKSNAYKKMQDEAPEKRKPLFAYLDLLDLMKIVRQRNNWPQFESVFNIPRQGEKGKKYYLDWMEEFNELRRIPAHSSSLRLYDNDQYEFLEWLKSELYPRLDKANT